MIDQRIEFVTLLSAAVSLLLVTSIAAAPSDDPVSGQTRIVSTGGRYLLEYRTHPSPIVLNEPFELFVRVRERYKRSPAKNVSLEVNAGMLAHNHGMFTRPEVIQTGAGEFQVKGMLFHMAGEWNLTFIVRRGLIKDRVETDIVVD
ncbi:hypothetical protein [Candidatus Thiosymbion oneisti]|uniref:hypothetical protein n=1 Tax=Candidatus Thiosymbion oneisti TaxID=589554 RepID=UPI00105BF8C1|nr:hypothetical protein [Candidatus Thiosymbion oneisti]